MERHDPGPKRELDGRRIALTGRLASMTRAEAIALITAHGGRHVREVTAATSMLIVGGNGWPLARDGRLTRPLEAAHALRDRGEAIEILGEESFLTRIGVIEPGDGVKRLYTVEQLARILDVPTRRIRSWMRAGLIRPERTAHRLAFFDFRQVAGARTLHDLLRSGLPTARLRRSLEQLQRWLPDAAGTLSQLQILETGHQVVLRLPDGRLAEPSGQLHIDFGSETSPAPALRLIDHADVGTAPEADWFAIAVRQEEAGDLVEAAHSYHRALLGEGPRPELAFNLGNLLYEMGEREAAAQRYMQAVECDPRYVEAWNNLGIVLGEVGRAAQAREALERALALEPDYADAHFNLGVVLEELGRLDEAHRHWQIYLKHDPSSRWARRLRERLEETPACDSVDPSR